jgi:hypothetical protein
VVDRKLAGRGGRIAGPLLGLALALLLTGCGPSPAEVGPRPLGGLSINCRPAGAMLFVDDRYMGTVAGLKGRPLMLPEGPHRIELRRDGYFAHYAEVTVAKGVKQRLEVTLRKEPF